MSTTAVRLWTETEFAQGREAWQELLAASRADPLFMSWDWQRTWWEVHGSTFGADLRLLAVEDGTGRLIGLAPLYLRSTVSLRVLRTRRLECLGTVWRDSTAAFTERYDFIARPEHDVQVLSALCTALEQQRDWADWVVSVVRPNSLVVHASEAIAHAGLRRSVEAIPARIVPLAGGYGQFLQTLSGGARRRLHHQRTRLTAPCLRYADPATIDAMLQRLDHWRAARWGLPHRASLVGRFEHALAHRLLPLGRLRLSELTDDGRPLSVMLNLRVEDTEYFLASAFDPARCNGFSPGYLHFGYAIEAACADGMARFDLLAGEGRHRDYKTDFCPTEQPLVSWQVVRSPLLRALHAIRGLRPRTDS